MKQVFRLVHTEARRRATEAVRAAPDGYLVTVAQPTRNNDQNALLHAILTDVAAQCQWAGKAWDVDSWKRLMTAAWSRAHAQGVAMVPAIDGQGFDVLYQHTSKLTKGECADLCEYIFAWGAEHDVVWSTSGVIA